jgi:hypothetical protein
MGIATAQLQPRFLFQRGMAEVLVQREPHRAEVLERLDERLRVALLKQLVLGEDRAREPILTVEVDTAPGCRGELPEFRLGQYQLLFEYGKRSPGVPLFSILPLACLRHCASPVVLS